MELPAYSGPWADDDPDANFKGQVAEYSRNDPFTTLNRLAELEPETVKRQNLKRAFNQFLDASVQLALPLSSELDLPDGRSYVVSVMPSVETLPRSGKTVADLKGKADHYETRAEDEEKPKDRQWLLDMAEHYRQVASDVAATLASDPEIYEPGDFRPPSVYVKQHDSGYAVVTFIR